MDDESAVASVKKEKKKKVPVLDESTVASVKEKKKKASKISSDATSSKGMTFVCYDDSDAEEEDRERKSGSGIDNSRGVQDSVLEDEVSSCALKQPKPAKKKSPKQIIIPVNLRVGTNEFECRVDDDDEEDEDVEDSQASRNTLSRYRVDNDRNTGVATTVMPSDVYALENANLAQTEFNFPELGSTPQRSPATLESPVTCWAQKSAAHEKTDTGVVVLTAQQLIARDAGNGTSGRRQKKANDEDRREEMQQQFEDVSIPLPPVRGNLLAKLRATTRKIYIPSPRLIAQPDAGEVDDEEEKDEFEDEEDEFEDEVESDEEDCHDDDIDFETEDIWNAAFTDKIVVGKAKYGRNKGNEISYV